MVVEVDKSKIKPIERQLTFDCFVEYVMANW